MKTTFILGILLLGISFGALAQSNGEKLYNAVVKRDTTLAKQLLREKADPNYIKSAGPWMKVNSLITAVSNKDLAMVKILLANKADVKWHDGFNTSALLYAAAAGSKELVLLLLTNGADIHDSDGNGNTVLSAAKESKNAELVAFVENKLR